MHTGTHAFGLDETFIEPQILPPPPTRHALLAFILALTAILHLGTSGWSDIHNGAEGRYASIARAMERTGDWTAPGPPLHYWLTIISFKLLGATAVAARLPVALATVAAVAFTFLLGERLYGYWRGFIAGLIHVCGLGSFIWMRMATPEPLFAAGLCATLFCAVSGYQRRRNRRWWYVAAWSCAALACLTKGFVGLLPLALILLLLAISFREARVRFRALLNWRNILLFGALLLPWLVATHFRVFAFFPPRFGEGVPLVRFVVSHFVWWFPAVLLVLPAISLGWRKVFRPHAFELADALPLCWMAVGFLPLLFITGRQDFDSINMWSPFALFAATAWDRTSPRLRLWGLGLVALAGASLVGAGALNVTATLPALPSAWLGVRSVVVLAGMVLLVFSFLAAYFSWKDRETLALAVLMLGMTPIGLSTAEGMARFGPYLSLAQAGRFIQPGLGENGEVLFEGSAFSGSSLEFYLDRRALIVEPTAADDLVLDKMKGTHPVFFIISRNRAPYWQDRLTERFHIYHQAAVCGSHVVISNHQ